MSVFTFEIVDGVVPGYPTLELIGTSFENVIDLANSLKNLGSLSIKSFVIREIVPGQLGVINSYEKDY